ncbi:MAG: TIR domain-containing protein [Cyanobacteria bacterium J06638_28]
MNPIQDVFISYGRADSRDFAAKLNRRLLDEGLEVWFDFDDIPLGVDYQKQIDDGIEKADNFLFIIAPHSVNSPYCGLEIELAVKRNKRILPLLHVEEISRETWQQRNPSGTDEQWAEYKEAGKHSCFPNMHPLISKINWVYFREGQDDFEKSVQDLLAIFKRDALYVRQHTELLNQALDWEQDNRDPRHLLVEEPLQKAKAWLLTRFRDRQPPCSPTTIHCQFITESLKYAQEGMTEVFLSHATEDRATLEKIYESLTRAGLTVWTNWRDIQTGIDFKTAINNGIERTDTVAYLISPAALASTWCQHEVDYALSLNKRVIPVLIEPVDLETLPATLRHLQFIDLTDNIDETDYLSDESELLNVLGEDVEYHRAHKLLLVNALKWESQLRNPCILLQGYTLRQTAAWLQVAQKRDRNRPTALQEAFVAASLEQPSDVELNVFIASDGRDLEFAKRLNETLQVQGERTWFEPDNSMLGNDYMAQIREGIERAENFIIVLSREALEDTAILEELKIAESLSKRIIAVTYQSLAGVELPPALQKSPRVDFGLIGEAFMTSFGTLYRILNSHPQHVRSHTRLLVRSLAWQDADRDDSALLRSKELTQAEKWLAQAGNQSPEPAELQKEYIQASRALSCRRVKQRSVAGLSLGGTLLVLILRFLGLFQGLELFAYDHLLRQRPNEPQDDRFLIVNVGEESGQYLREGLINGRYEPSIGTIPDDALNEALTILEDNQVRLVGLDFYRDFPATPELAATFRDADYLITLCKGTADLTGGVPKAPEVPQARVGFSDFDSDRKGGDTFLRRHLALIGPDSVCASSQSLSLLLAERYLEEEGITITDPSLPDGGFLIDGLMIGDTIVPSLFFFRGPYYPLNFNTDFFNGYQLLLNFRTAPDPEQNKTKSPRTFAPIVSLKALLDGDVSSELIENRIVLIGYSDFTDRNADDWVTPYGNVPGVFLQGQMTSQLISTALDGRSLIRWLPFWQEALWILFWSAAGSIAVRQINRSSQLAIVVAAGTGLIYICCYGVMVSSALWIPLVPTLAAFWLTSGGVAMLTYRLRQP